MWLYLKMSRMKHTSSTRLFHSECIITVWVPLFPGLHQCLHSVWYALALSLLCILERKPKNKKMGGGPGTRVCYEYIYYECCTYTACKIIISAWKHISLYGSNTQNIVGWLLFKNTQVTRIHQIYGHWNHWFSLSPAFLQQATMSLSISLWILLFRPLYLLAGFMEAISLLTAEDTSPYRVSFGGGQLPESSPP